MLCNVASMAVTLGLQFDGGKLRDIRERAGLSTRDLADLCTANGYSVSQNHIWRLETGRSGTTAPLLKALAEALNVQIDDLLTQGDDSAVA